MIINVSQEDINNGIAKSNISCPIGLAIKKIFPYSKIFVNPWTEITVGYFKYKLTKNCLRFMRDFDKGDLVHPFKFNLMEVKSV